MPAWVARSSPLSSPGVSSMSAWSLADLASAARTGVGGVTAFTRSLSLARRSPRTRYRSRMSASDVAPPESPNRMAETSISTDWPFSFAACHAASTSFATSAAAAGSNPWASR